MTTVKMVPLNRPSDNPDDISVPNDGFYPNVSVKAFRAAMDIGTAHDDQEVCNRLLQAVFAVNRDLSVWRFAQSVPAIHQIPDADSTLQDVNRLESLYVQAVYSRCKGELINERRGVMTTKSGHSHADSLESTAGVHLAASTRLIRQIQGKTPNTVALI